MRERFPDARVGRLDRDTRGGGAAGSTRMLDRMRAGEIDILVGTQMVTKGHDFPGVTLVGVLLPTRRMRLPDFRAAERTFQLLEQVAGRAGRGERPGRVIVQTYQPDHPAVAAVATHDYDGFARGELAAREETGYPPFARMIVLRSTPATQGPHGRRRPRRGGGDARRGLVGACAGTGAGAHRAAPRPYPLAGLALVRRAGAAGGRGARGRGRRRGGRRRPRRCRRQSPQRALTK